MQIENTQYNREKASSGHFKGTTGLRNWNTSIVWEHLEPTRGNYGGTDLPRSFNIDTPQGKMWTHGNATKHMHEAILSLKDDPKLKTQIQNSIHNLFYMTIGKLLEEP